MSSSSTASKLEGLAGLEGAKRVVRRLALSGDQTHAVLLYGVNGSGKEELALVLAQAWLCRSPTSEAGADGSCLACNAFAHGKNPDLLGIEPKGPSALIVNEQITATDNKDGPVPLLTFFRTGPLMSRHKVAILSDAHRMNPASSNALLKTLEEPLPHAKLIITTDTIGGIRATILSRCLAVACSTPEAEQLRSAFPEASESDLILAEGAPGRLKKILDHGQEYRAIAAFAASLAGRSRGQVLVTSDELRALAERLGSALDLSTRAANAETLSVLAVALGRDASSRPGHAQAVIEAHQRILGNGSAGVVFDAMFAQILGGDNC